MLMTIQWAQKAWKEVLDTKRKNSYKKYGLIQSYGYLMEVEEKESDFEGLI